MRLARTLVAAAAVTALVAAPVASATAASHKPAPKPRFIISALQIIGSKASYDVTSAAATVRLRVQVKDFDKKFDPASVKVVVVEKVSGAAADTVTVTTHRVGRSRVVSSWLGTITVPKGSAAASYCLKLVKVDDASPATLPVLATAKGLAGRDCFTVTNTTPPAAPAPTA
jgi:hypothetical protein